MRLIHTADWHLGQNFRGFDRQAEHRVFLDWLLDTLERRQADALLIAGDVFDQANPGADAQRLFFEFLADARRRCPQLDIVLIAGNHDSPSRLEAPQPILASLHVHVAGRFVARTPDDLERWIVPLHDAGGRRAASVLAVPFLRPADLERPPDGRYETAVRDAYARLADAAARHHGDDALVVMGHLHVRGAGVSPDSERRLIIGGEESLDAGIFPAATYVALGHLHRPQSVGTAAIRYSGSPLPLSFSEIHYPHQVVEIDIEGNRLAAVTPLRVPRPAAILRVPEVPLVPDEALAVLEAWSNEPTQPGLEPLIEVPILTSIVPTDLRARIEAALAGKAVRLCGIQRHRPEAANPTAQHPDLPTTDPHLQLEPWAIFERLLQEHPDVPERDAVRAAFGELLDRAAQERS